jgi:hypothetical protein
LLEDEENNKMDENTEKYKNKSLRRKEKKIKNDDVDDAHFIMSSANDGSQYQEEKQPEIHIN